MNVVLEEILQDTIITELGWRVLPGCIRSSSRIWRWRRRGFEGIDLAVTAYEITVRLLRLGSG